MPCDSRRCDLFVACAFCSCLAANMIWFADVEADLHRAKGQSAIRKHVYRDIGEGDSAISLMATFVSYASMLGTLLKSGDFVRGRGCAPAGILKTGRKDQEESGGVTRRSTLFAGPC